MKYIYFTALERKLNRSSFGGDDFLLAGHWALDNLNELSGRGLQILKYWSERQPWALK